MSAGGKVALRWNSHLRRQKSLSQTNLMMRRPTLSNELHLSFMKESYCKKKVNRIFLRTAYFVLFVTASVSMREPTYKPTAFKWFIHVPSALSRRFAGSCGSSAAIAWAHILLYRLLWLPSFVIIIYSSHLVVSGPGLEDVACYPSVRDEEWPRSIQPPSLVFRDNRKCSIQPYRPSQFARQFGYTQGRVGAPRCFEMRHGSLLDGWRACCGFSCIDPVDHFLYPSPDGGDKLNHYYYWYLFSFMDIRDDLLVFPGWFHMQGSGREV